MTIQRRTLITTISLMVLFLASPIWAADFPDLSAKVLKAKLDSGEQMLLVNPLSDIEFNEGHIPGSVNIPLQQIKSTDRLPADKSVAIVTYCLGPK